MKASQPEFREAIAPVLADVERSWPGLLRVEETPGDPHMSALIWEQDGSGSGVYLSDAAGPGAVADMAVRVQEIMFEATCGTWPACPSHPGRHPLTVFFQEGEQSMWGCPHADDGMYVIGELPSQQPR